MKNKFLKLKRKLMKESLFSDFDQFEGCEEFLATQRGRILHYIWKEALNLRMPIGSQTSYFFFIILAKKKRFSKEEIIKYLTTCVNVNLGGAEFDRLWEMANEFYHKICE